MALAVILELLRRTRRSAGLSTDLSRGSNLGKFELREELASYFQKTRNTEKKHYFDLVCQDSTRHNRIDTTLQKEASTQFIATEQAFGAEDLFLGFYLPCRAVGVSRGSLALVAVTYMRKWLWRLPSLKNYFSHFVHLRQALIFFQAKIKSGSQTSFTLQQLLFYSLLTRIKVDLSCLLGSIVYQKGGFRLTKVRAKKYLAQNISLVICEYWGFAKQNLEAIVRTDLLINQFPKAYWRLAADLVAKIFRQQNQINRYQIHQPGEYKYSNLAATDQPPVSQICPQIDYSQLEQKTTNIVPIDGCLSFGGFGTGLNGLGKDYLENANQSLELSFVSHFLYQRLKLPFQFFAFRQVVEILSAISILKTTRSLLYLHSCWQEDSAKMLTVRNHPQQLINKLQTINSVIHQPEITARLYCRRALAIGEQLVISEEGRGQRAEGRREQYGRGFQPATNCRPPNFILVGALNPCSLRSPEALRHRPSAFCLRTSAFPGKFFAFAILGGNTIDPMKGLINRWGELQKIPITQESLDDFVSLAPEEDTVLLKTGGKIQLENVSFGFHPDEAPKRLKNILFDVRAGQTIGIVGASGSGKTTIINFLTGLYRSTSGRIRISIDGHDISRVYLESLRKQSGVVTQEYFLFSGTIFDNITLYNREFTLKQVIVTTNLAGVNRFIRTLLLGFHTPTGKRGIILSEGQTIAISRALIINPSILILDELTSSLDAESLCQSQQNLSLCVHLGFSDTDTTLNTLIFIHHLSRLCNIKYILVLDWVPSVEQITHEQLTRYGLYSDLKPKQLNL